VRHNLGAILLEAGRARAAEKVYREDLTRFPDNGWSLLETAWEHADIEITASRF